MYSVLLVDDEPGVLNTLSTSIQWKELGIDQIFTSYDGLQALNILSLHKIDLMITDIKMPGLDGLSLLSEVRTLYPDTHCILLTAYGEFEYAKKAMQLGLENYLLKPLQTEELNETIEKALDNIYTSRKISNQLFRNNILSRWINGKISNEELSERAYLLDVNLYLPEYCIVCIRKKQPNVSLTHYCRMCIDALTPVFEVHQFKDENNNYVFIIGGQQIVPAQLLNYFTKEAMKINSGHLIALSMGNTVSNISSLPGSYQLACNLLNNTEMTAPDMIILTPSQGDMDKGNYDSKLNTAFRLPENSEEFSPIIQNAINYIHKHYGESISIKDFCVKKQMNTSYLGYLFKKETGLFFNNYLTQYRIGTSIRLLLETDMKINDIAETVGFSTTSYYISCFKKQTGLSPVKYRSRQL